jgi:hypothetical protein
MFEPLAAIARRPLAKKVFENAVLVKPKLLELY